MIKAVIDTNILISGADDENSVAWRIVKEVIEGRIEAFATHQTMGENRQMLRKLVRDREYKERVEEFFRKLKIVKVYERLNVVADPEDNKLVESAVSAGADFLITNDREVLDVEKYHGTNVVTPEDFWAKYKGEEADDEAWRDFGKMLFGK